MAVNSQLSPQANPTLFSYVVARDYGFAPNPFFGYCTLATCKPKIRKYAEVGDWVIGTSSQESHKCKHHLVYAMKVTEVLTFNQYWNDKRFQLKKPVFNKSTKFAYGDNIYHNKNGNWHQEKSHHRENEFKTENCERDTSADKVLISDKFIYFGSEPIRLPPNLNSIDNYTQGYKCKFEKPLIDETIKWLEKDIFINKLTRQPRPAKWLKKSPLEYQNFVIKSLKHENLENDVLLFGLNGELGSIYSCIKKKVRDEIFNEFSKQEMEEELGDTLWYITAICHKFNFDLEELLINNLNRIKNKPQIIFDDNPKLKYTDVSILKKMKIPKNIVNFSRYQKIAKDNIIGDKLKESLSFIEFCYPLTKIGHDIYEVFYSGNFNIDEGKKNLENRLGDLCWYLSVIADYYDISMDDVVTNNVNKISSLFMEKICDLTGGYFDKDLKLGEKLPRKFTAYFHNKDSKIAYIVINSLAIGDFLDDNSHYGDGYRYHDGIHFTIYALLGWSPVWRGFFRKKRKSLSEVDRAEDGARARIVEEMVVKTMHSYFKFLDAMQKEKRSVNFGFLKTISLLTKGLEIENITYAQWEEVILRSHEIYNKLKTYDKGGKLHIDIENKTIEYEELTEEEKDNPFGKRENTFEN